ncbi:Required for respiratory growth protein 9, mitochondrial [Colletotrichum chlorophyti]|uniref:Required for respiratory growth protein 9, mitochondrial n=1 Tax=Colletotrichum chlorophyti TaxID=708187 RepID=A0A1Q8RY74_9PEZI|nr:Required for respiratory growth protein 9, mitochondrial [Colletotrichum chlorophyti]
MAQLHISQPAAASTRTPLAPHLRKASILQLNQTSAFSTSTARHTSEGVNEEVKKGKNWRKKRAREAAVARERETAGSDPESSTPAESRPEDSEPTASQLADSQPDDTKPANAKPQKRTSKSAFSRGTHSKRANPARRDQKGPLDDEAAAVATDEDGTKPKREHWQIQKEALKKKFPEGWKPLKRLSPDAMAGIRALHAQFPQEYTLRVLADKFEVSPEAIRRILKSKWQAAPEEEEKRQERWFRRGVSVWTRYAEMGVKPPSKWRREGVARDPSYHEMRKAAIERRKMEEASEDAGERLQRKLSDTIL